VQFLQTVPPGDQGTDAGWVAKNLVERNRHEIRPALGKIKLVARGKGGSIQDHIPSEGMGFFRALLSFPVDLIRVRLSLVSSRSHFATRDDYHEFSTMITRLLRLKRQAAVFRTAKTVMTYWRGFHVVLAVFLVLVIVVHIATAWYLGYRWVF